MDSVLERSLRGLRERGKQTQEHSWERFISFRSEALFYINFQIC
jgi:hypothetical protein